MASLSGNTCVTISPGSTFLLEAASAVLHLYYLRDDGSGPGKRNRILSVHVQTALDQQLSSADDAGCGDAKYTMPIMVSLLRGDIYKTEFGSIYMGLAMTALPLFVVYFLLSRYIIAGVALGGVKLYIPEGTAKVLLSELPTAWHLASYDGLSGVSLLVIFSPAAARSLISSHWSSRISYRLIISITYPFLSVYGLYTLPIK